MSARARPHLRGCLFCVHVPLHVSIAASLLGGSMGCGAGEKEAARKVLDAKGFPSENYAGSSFSLGGGTAEEVLAKRYDAA